METRIKDIFFRAKELEPEERDSFLDKACGDDTELRAEVERMLADAGRADSFFGGTKDDDFTVSTDGSGKTSGKLAAPASVIRDGTPEAAARRPQPVGEGTGDMVGHYKLRQKIGEGGFGVVWMAEQVEPINRMVALKVVKAGMDTEEVLARFEAERQALAMMDHPNIAKVFDAGATESGRPYFVMELVKGIPITEFCDLQKFDTRQRLELFRDVCSAVNHAHQKGVIHRDLKPSNVMVTLHSDKPVVKVIDFGIAKATQQRLTEKTLFTRFEQFLGTPAYMSPEQAALSGLDLDTRADIYSLGVLLYELLAGRPPFDPKTLLSAGYDEMRRIIQEDEPLRPSLQMSSVSGEELNRITTTHGAEPQKLGRLLKGDLDWIVMKAIEKDRARRYETANALGTDIHRYLNAEPVLAAAPSAMYRFRKFAHRNRGTLTTAAVFVSLLLVGSVVSTWQAIKATRAEERAREAAAVAEKARISADENAEVAIERAHQLRVQAYAADIAVAANAVEQHEIAQARRLLNRHVPKVGEEDIRGFEWRYLWRKTQGDDLGVAGGYRGLRGGVAISPDGALVACNEAPGIVVRRGPKGQVIRKIEVAESYGPLRFSPDGRYLVSVQRDRVQRWRTDTWEEASSLQGTGWPLVYAPDGSFFVASSGKRLVRYDAETFQEIRTLCENYEGGGGSFNLLATAISPDGDTLYGYGGELGIRCWDLKSGKELGPIMEWARGPYSLAMSSRGILAVGLWGGHVVLWDTRERKQLAALEAHYSWVPCMEFSSGGSELITVGADKTIGVFDVDEAGNANLRVRMAGHSGEVWALALASDGKHLYTGSSFDGTTRLWEIPAEAKLRQVRYDGDRPLGFDADGKGMVAWFRNEGFKRVEFATGEVEAVADMSLPEGADASWGDPLAPPLWTRVAGREAVAFADEEKVTIWNFRTGQAEAVLEEPGLEPHSVAVVPFAFSKDGSLFATANETHGIRVWKRSDWSFVELKPDWKWRAQLRFSEDNRLLVAVPEFHGATAIAIDLETRKVIAEFKISGKPTTMDLSPDGSRLGVGTMQNVATIWDVATGERLHVLKGHAAGVQGVAFSPDGRTLATTADKRLKLWNVETGSELITMTKSGIGVKAPQFSPDGRTIVAMPNGGRIMAWRTPALKDIDATLHAKVDHEASTVK